MFFAGRSFLWCEVPCPSSGDEDVQRSRSLKRRMPVRGAGLPEREEDQKTEEEEEELSTSQRDPKLQRGSKLRIQAPARQALRSTGAAVQLNDRPGLSELRVGKADAPLFDEAWKRLGSSAVWASLKVTLLCSSMREDRLAICFVLLLQRSCCLTGATCAANACRPPHRSG